MCNYAPNYVFPVLTFGCSKPSDLEFLNEDIISIKDLLQNGVLGIPVVLKHFVSDLPAKAYAKAVKQYNSIQGTCQHD